MSRTFVKELNMSRYALTADSQSVSAGRSETLGKR